HFLLQCLRGDGSGDAINDKAEVLLCFLNATVPQRRKVVLHTRRNALLAVLERARGSRADDINMQVVLAPGVGTDGGLGLAALALLTTPRAAVLPPVAGGVADAPVGPVDPLDDALKSGHPLGVTPAGLDVDGEALLVGVVAGGELKTDI